MFSTISCAWRANGDAATTVADIRRAAGGLLSPLSA
jgi:hypothetical protein